MLNSVTRNLIILIFVLSPIANAELWVKHDNGTIQSKFHGDCFKAGFCGKNNANLLTGWIEVDSTEYQNASNKYYKVSGGDVVEMTQQEKDDLDAQEAQAIQDALDQAIAQAKVDAKNYVDNSNEAQFRLTKSLAWVIFNSMVETRNKINEIISTSGVQVDPLPNRTWTQLKTAVKNEIDAENAS